MKRILIRMLCPLVVSFFLIAPNVINAKSVETNRIPKKASDVDFHYYSVEFMDLITQSNFDELAFREELLKQFTWKHQRVDGEHDKVVKQCEGHQGCYYQFTDYSYRDVREFMFGYLDLRYSQKGAYVKDVYCQKNYTKAHGVGVFKIPNSNKINAEHTWPQSRFNRRMPKRLQKVDLHHLFPTNSIANSTRGSYKFSEVDGHEIRDCDGSYRGVSRKGSFTAFQPPANHRGNVARALFYFSMRYDLKISEIEEQYLREWHKDDPVDDAEKDRHDKIFRYQGIRNPFIDFPFLVSLIDNF